jgi:putative DNA primase/helicase
MTAALHFRVLADLAGGKVGKFDVACPVCSHQRRRQNQRKRVMRLWADADFISFNCVHCGAAGYARSGLGPVGVAPRPRAATRHDDDHWRTLRAREIWDRGVDLRGTPAEEYLRSRHIELSDTIAGSELRFDPRCPWSKADDDVDHPEYPPGWRPTLLAAFRSLETDEVVAIHRIRVDVPKRWPKTRRKMLGPVANAAVKLAHVTDTVAITEGIETAMAANQMGYGPAWAVGCANAVKRFPVLPGVGRLILLEENNAASREAVAACGQRWARTGREVIRVVPDVGDDLNDELMLKGNF